MSEAEAQVAEATDEGPSSEEELKPVPYDRFKEVNTEKNEWKQRAEKEAEDRRRLEDELRSLKDDVSKLKETKPQQRDYTREELQAAVDNGQISQAQADSIAEQQIERRLEAKLRSELESRVASTTSEQRLEAELDAYKRAIPGLTDRNSKEWQRSLDEYADLVRELGKPKTDLDVLKYERLALKQAFGPLSRIKKAGAAPDPHQETGGGSGSSQISGVPAKLQKNARLRKHYESMIERGHYSGMDDPRLLKELQYAK